jgi:DNA helicase II / ATP-dependent DNA helicase PcrA
MFSAHEIAEALGSFTPTPEQVAVIEAPAEGVYRVIAGAGSGKTETMAQRVLWLVANKHALAHEVLGLTFTRKAAGELSHRIVSRLRALHATGLVPLGDEFERPTVVTYNSFAARIYREHAALLGLDPDATVLTEASAWGLARRVVVNAALPGIADWGLSVSEVTRMVRLLTSRMAENSVQASAVADFAEEFRRLADLPVGGTGTYAMVDTWVSTIDSLETLVHLVGAYQSAKEARGVIEFSDQVALARKVVSRHPSVVRDITDQHRTVLLDEYQDTSVAQTALLSTLFRGRPVMAVGDPHQAIYGWRGASSSNLVDFTNAFAGEHSETFALQTSWRNGRQILAVANQVSKPLSELPGPSVGVLTAGPNASDNSVSLSFVETVHDEADAVAQWFESHLASPGPKPPSAAILFRQRHHQRLFVDRLATRGIRSHVLGLGGLLDDPGVVDVVCALRILGMPHAEGELVRLLTGGRWRLGVADVAALATTTRWLQGRDASGKALPEEVKQKLRESVGHSDNAGLLDALTFIARAPADHHQRALYSPEGLVRLNEAHHTLRQIQDAGVTSVDELIPLIERALNVDIEVLAHPQRDSYLAAREALLEAVHSYLAVSDDSGPSGFVRWLDEAEMRDNLTPRVEPPEPGCVQVLTIHGAKGLEWDLVAVPRLVDDEIPQATRDSKGWLSRGELPYFFRGDQTTLPVFDWRQAATRKEAVTVFENFTDQVKAHRLAEERRLMYVAVTRARHELLLTGSFWAHQQKPRTPSVFVRELAEAGLVDAPPSEPQNDTPPEPPDSEARIWPGDPLGKRRVLVQAAADAVRSQRSAVHKPNDEAVFRLQALEERGGLHPKTARLPLRLPASSLERLAGDPRAYLEALARPLPRAPHKSALVGTLFHSYVESRLGRSVPGPLVETDNPSAGEDSRGFDVEHLIEAFEASEFATTTPVAIETELHVPLAGHLIICKIDAVFPTSAGVRIVDWKTGKKPSSEEDIAAKSIQLSAYRLAWSEWSGLPLDAIDASFWFVEDALLITPRPLLDRQGLEDVILGAKRLLS